ncbi:MAG: tyrosine-type recombinase/integrase [Acidimicrobiales bacterium]
MTTKDGKRRQAEKTFRGTAAQAQKALNGLLTADPTTTSEGRTVGQLLDEWITFREVNGAATKTIAENRRKVEHDIRPAVGSVVLVDLTAKHLDDAYAAWLTRKPRPLSATTVHHLHAIVSAALSQAVKWSYITANPAKQASPPAIAQRSTDVPTPEIVGKLITKAEECNDRVMAAAISLAFVTGARRGELCGLHWSDVPLGDGVGAIRIERSISDVDNVISVKGTKTGKGRTVPIDARSVAILQKIRTEQETFAEAAGSTLVADPYVLSQSGDGSTPFEPGRLTDRFRLICGRAGVTGVRFHDLRHAHITYLIAAGVDVVAVAARAGHAQPTMTLSRYGHALPTSGDWAASVIGGLIPN